MSERGETDSRNIGSSDKFRPTLLCEGTLLTIKQGGVMVWSGIMMDGHTGLHFFDTGSVTAQRYRNEVLEPYVRLFRDSVGPDFIFMDDNAPCHRAVLIYDFLETENIQRMS
ncbi:transposable element Tcb2 transposase [Trichonephila clavipes]|nr:transposable element Tcb2 transposase [Trichonephila clavipes]